MWLKKLLRSESHYFYFCYKIAHIENRGTKPLIDIHKSLGGWPVIEGDNWDESQWSWTKSVKDFRARGYSADYIRKFLTYLSFLLIFF